MLFLTAEDFLHQVKAIPPLTRDEEWALAAAVADGDPVARTRLVRGYLPFVAAFVRRAPRTVRTLTTGYACIAALERAVDRFDFTREDKPFARYLGWALRQTVTRCIADHT